MMPSVSNLLGDTSLGESIVLFLHKLVPSDICDDIKFHAPVFDCAPLLIEPWQLPIQAH